MSSSPVAAIPNNQPTLGRLGGADRVITAIAISEQAFPSAATAGAVVLARDDDFADGVTGTPLAVAANAPLLLTAPTSLDPRTDAELRRVLAPGGTVYLLGGTSALTPTVESRVRGDGYQSVRLAGSDRFETAATIAQALGDPATVLLATGLNFPDALVAGPAAVQAKAAILLTADSVMPNATASYLGNHPDDKQYAIGDQAAAADPQATAVRGPDRYATGVAVANQFWPAGPLRVALATGLNFPDALAGGAHIGRNPTGPLLLTLPTELPPDVDTYLKGAGCSEADESWVYGQSDVVSDAVFTQANEDLSGSFCP